MTRRNTPANLQPSGNSAVWVKLHGPTPARALELHVGDQPAGDVTVFGNLITGIIPEAILASVGSHPVVIKGPLSAKNIPVGIFSVYD